MKTDNRPELEDKEIKLNMMKVSYEKGARAFNERGNAADTGARENLKKLMTEIECLEKELYGSQASSSDSPGILLKRHQYTSQT